MINCVARQKKITRHKKWPPPTIFHPLDLRILPLLHNHNRLRLSQFKCPLLPTIRMPIRKNRPLILPQFMVEHNRLADVALRPTQRRRQQLKSQVTTMFLNIRYSTTCCRNRNDNNNETPLSDTQTNLHDFIIAPTSTITATTPTASYFATLLQQVPIRSHHLNKSRTKSVMALHTSSKSPNLTPTELLNYKNK